MIDVYVAAGSNVDPEKNLKIALRHLSKHYKLLLSPAYRNRAVGFEGDDFINLVVGFQTDDSIDAVIANLQAAEAACGRLRDAPKWAPRTMDLDLLLYGDLLCDQPKLKLPRPDLLKRPYMLKPMANIAPHLKHPVVGKSMAHLWAEFDQHSHAMAPVEMNFDLST